MELAAEDYRRLARLAKTDNPPKLELMSEVQFHDEDVNAYNILADIPGTARGGEYVMAGAHLDSWVASDGAQDHAAGSAVVMEAARILRALNVRPKRTIRFALWNGEEQGILGSLAYSERNLLEEGFSAVRWERASDNGGFQNPAALPGGAANAANLFHPRLPRYGQLIHEQKRTGFTGARWVRGRQDAALGLAQEAQLLAWLDEGHRLSVADLEAEAEAWRARLRAQLRALHAAGADPGTETLRQALHQLRAERCPAPDPGAAPPVKPEDDLQDVHPDDPTPAPEPEAEPPLEGELLPGDPSPEPAEEPE
jgi:hypothetical protein